MFHEMPCFSHYFLANWGLSRISDGWLELLSHLWALIGKKSRVNLLPWRDKSTRWEILQTLKVFKICWAARKYKCPSLALSSIIVWKKKIQFRRHKFNSKTTLFVRATVRNCLLSNLLYFSLYLTLLLTFSVASYFYILVNNSQNLLAGVWLCQGLIFPWLGGGVSEQWCFTYGKGIRIRNKCEPIIEKTARVWNIRPPRSFSPILCAQNFHILLSGVCIGTTTTLGSL